MKTGKQRDTNVIQMLERGINIIELIQKNNAPMGISEISIETGLSKATVYRLLYTMEKYNYIEQDKMTDKYGLGLSFIRIGDYVKSRININKIARPHMEQLVETTGETAYLCKMYEDEALIVEMVQGEASALYSMVTPVIPMYCSALGRVLLADCSSGYIEKYLKRELRQRTMKTKTSKLELEKELKKIKQDGVAIEIEEYEYGMACIAAPIHDKNGKVIASISISGPASRIEYKGMEETVKATKQTSKNISKQLR